MKKIDKFWSQISDGLERKVRNNLILTTWAVANGVSRVALSCPIFDAWMTGIGAQPVVNRHDLQDVYLPKLNEIVVKEIVATLSTAPSVCASCDGWRDRLRRDFVDVALSWTNPVTPKQWEISVVHLDLIYLPGSATADVIASLVKQSIDDFVPEQCLLATMTSDGAANERLAADSLVQEGNGLHCSAHLIQLAIEDVLSLKKASVPPDCAAHRSVIRKSHDLVVFINGHKATHTAFSLAAQAKKNTDEGTRNFDALVVDCETRWDSELGLLERLCYFDPEIVTLFRNPELEIPSEAILNRFEFDLAYAMTLVLDPLREFTKFVQYRNKVTLAYVPKKIDELMTALAPTAFADLLTMRADGVLAAVESFQAALVAKIRMRFSPLFEPGSLAMAARMIIPGPSRFAFENFHFNDQALVLIRENLLDDVLTLLPSGLDESMVQAHRTLAQATLAIAERELNVSPADADPLKWWPTRPHLASLFPVIMLLLAIPASSAEDERAFSSASFVLSQRRARLDLENFRKEQRIRSYIVGGSDPHTAQGRQLRVDRLNSLLRRYGELVEAHRNEEANDFGAQL